MPVVFRSTIRDTGRGLAQHSDFVPRRPGEVAKTYQEIKSQCLASGKLWEDPDFPAIAGSIFFQNPPSAWPNIKWKRPRVCISGTSSISNTSPLASYRDIILRTSQVNFDCVLSVLSWHSSLTHTCNISGHHLAGSSILIHTSNMPQIAPNHLNLLFKVRGKNKMILYFVFPKDDCWLVAAVASLTTNQALLDEVIPPDQSFDKDYAGVFRFQFWQYGRWVEVLIDDRLPTHDNKLIFMHSKDRNEFWSALLEKAYAKLHGSYESLNCGLASEALTDFTGGIVDRHELKSNAPSHLFQLMMKAQRKGCLMSCTIIVPEGKMTEQLRSGLVSGHAYSITDVRTIHSKTSRGLEKIHMVRIRNPWGNSTEWNGAWSDGSQEWKTVSDAEKCYMDITFEHDGEFWMSYKDFVSNFDRLEICYLGPDSQAEGEQEKEARKWAGCLFEGAWNRRVNAGGCRNYKSTFWTNPQYRVKISDADSDDEDRNGSITIGLMQKQRRQLMKQGGANLNIGYTIYKTDSQTGDTITICDQSFFDRPVVAKSKEFTDMREVTCSHKLSPGEYVVVPSTFDPNEEGEFILRIFSERQNDQAGELDHVTTTVDTQEHVFRDKHPNEEENKQMAHETFVILAGDDGEIDAFELHEILNSTFKKDFIFNGFTKDMARGLVTMHDFDASGKLGFEEFKTLWKELLICKRVFKAMDADGNGYFCSNEFRNALNTLGFRVNNSTFKLIVIRYSDKDGHVRFDDFVNCYFELKTLFDTCKAFELTGGGFAAEQGSNMDDQNQDGPEVVTKAEVTGCGNRYNRNYNPNYNRNYNPNYNRNYNPNYNRNCNPNYNRNCNPYPNFGYNQGGSKFNFSFSQNTYNGTVNNYNYR